MLFQKAEVLFKKGSLGHAEEMLARAVRADPEQPEYKTLLAWVQAERVTDQPALEDGEKSSAYKQQIEALNAVLDKEPDFERALHFRGVLLKRSGYHIKAIRDFKAVVELNPHNIDAAREVRLHEKKTKHKGPGLFGGLFSGKGKGKGKR
jgi:tetratricopeptide (TPR) repeat protein